MSILRLGIFLTIVCSISAIALSLTNAITVPLIEENRRKSEEAALREVLPQAGRFETRVKLVGQTETKYFVGLDEEGNVVGMVLVTSPPGYAGPIDTWVGVDSHGSIVGVKVRSKETPGLGNKIEKESFLAQFKGKRADKLALKKDDPVHGTIDAITAATISSRALTDGLRCLLEEFKDEFEK